MAHIKALPAMKLTALSFTADFSKKRMLFNFNSPALVIGKMPMETVKLIHSHIINKLFNGFHTEEVTAFVKLHTSPGIKGSVADFTAGNLVFIVKKLLYGNHCIKRTVVITCKDFNAGFSNLEKILLFLHFFRVDEADVRITAFLAD